MLEELKINCPFDLPKKRQFNILTGVICELFLRQLGKVNFGRFKLFYINLDENNLEENYLYNEHYIDFLGVNRSFEFSSFWDKTSIQQKNLLNKIIVCAFLKAIEYFNIDDFPTEKLQSVSKKIIEDNYNLEGILDKRKTISKYGKEIDIYFKYDEKENRFETSLLINDNVNVTQNKINLVCTWPFMFILHELFNNIKWLNERQILIAPLNENDFKLIVDIVNKTVNVEGEFPDWVFQ